MTGLEVVAVAAVLGAKSAIRRRREGPGIAETVAKAYLAEQRIALIKTQAQSDLRKMGRR
jgi:hypothetical protein